MNKPDPMVYLDDMEQTDPSIMNKVLEAAAAYNASGYTEREVLRTLEAMEASGICTIEGFGALLSPAASPYLEDMARIAQRETRKRFGNSVYIFTPLYIANYCENACVYCGFNCHNKIKRARLSLEEIEEEMKAIAATGLEEILLLTGESPSMSNPEYIGEACALARNYFRMVGLEVYPMNSDAYAMLRNKGADFVTVFQETYDTELYGQLHPSGRKRIFPYRFNAQERALKGGMRGAAFASLLGLGGFRRDAFAAGIHASLIQRKYPHAEISFSCPRLRPISTDATLNPKDVGEAELLQVMCAYRIFMPHAGITISTRENARFRDSAVEIAATKISAGVDVGIGGHSGKAAGDEQFEISDTRTVEEIYRMLLAKGLQPVMSDYIYI
ncbi:2-iminoacetate synthase ThiH [Leadbettera azotonutricia]|uniref:Thiazole biosynthesis protein ThiH n=2 Tax=Bacteria TaxID=2 RepID=F5YA25_LEAAZ|nr:2-iminoacetate synthase ThiH [Leadbettera azotonutricia]AEF82816.1 thiazole biosynthesis protein ThiH [Leadbettera azotonutricia ZAS-9]